MKLRPILNRLLYAVVTASITALPCTSAQAALSLVDSPLFLSTSAEPLVMLALSNDEQLYRKAYTDFDDVDGDGLLDTTYKDTIDYFGYFDSRKCYSYSGTTAAGNFAPQANAAGSNNHACDAVSGGRWSGNFLNWATMARMDALRKVLYGGYRSTDTSSLTVLERAYLPNDNHTWTKFYSAADLNNYTPYDIATYPSGITMCNVTPQDASTATSETNTTSPRLRVAKGQWPSWSAQEVKQCLWVSEFTPIDVGSSPNDGGATPDKIAEFTVRVKVCDSSLPGSENCKTYGSSLKPVGLLQDFADADRLKIRFGLMTGSYGKRKSGGVLRKNIARLTDEIDASTGVFTNVDGIIRSINLMRVSRYSYSQPGYFGTSPDNCPFNQNTWANGSCANWGNPLGEMYLESLRYLVGGKSPNFSSNDTTWIANLKESTWVNPYGAASTSPVGGGASYCAKPSVLAISTGVLSFDNDEYAGASDLPGLGGSGGVNTQTDLVGAGEGINGQNWYVGSLTGGSPTDVCSSRTVNSLSAVTGICPESAGLQGSFKITGLASYAHKRTTALQLVGGKKISPVDTFAVALAPPIPAIKVAVGGNTVTIIPAGYNVRNSNAMQLVNFRVISQTATAGTFFMNFENAPAGSDFDNDIKGLLSYVVSGSNIKVIMYQIGSTAGATQNLGYIIDGVTNAGTYYVLSNNDLLNATQQGGATFSTLTPAAIDTACGAAGYAANPATVANELCRYNQAGSATTTSYMRGIKTHTAGGASTSSLKSPLWYAAKWGGFKDKNNDGAPQTAEWDDDGDGVPDTYFPVTNASLLGSQLSKALTEIIARVSSASSASVNSGSINSGTRVYQAKFSSGNWTGQLLSFPVNTDGTLATQEWDAATVIPAANSRAIITTNTNTNAAVAFRWANIGSNRQAQLQPSDTLGQDRLDYLRGDNSKEQQNGGSFRQRLTNLGDIINSTPVFVGKPLFVYPDTLESKPYSAFRAAKASRIQMVYAGANDGMLHGFDATTGAERLAFIPSAVFANLGELTKPAYQHLYFVDSTPTTGDAFYNNNWHTVLVGGLNKGGKSIYALDITDPSNFSEANATSIFRWEFTDTDLGYTFSRPAVVRLHNGKWAAVFGSGYNNGGRAWLYIVDVETGTLIRKIDTGIGDGLTTPAMVDINGDSVVDYAYAGDLLGNLWKFNLSDSNPSNWDVAYGSSTKQPLYVAKDASGTRQPITGRPEVARGPRGAGMIVLFGTGKYLETADKTPTQTQSFYGVIDGNTLTSSDIVSGRSVLTQQQILVEQLFTIGSRSVPLRVTTDNAVGSHGWYMDLLSGSPGVPPPSGFKGEMQVSDPMLRNGRIVFTTLIPDPDPCAFGGTSWLMEMNALSGARLSTTPFDLSLDGKFDDLDLVTVTLPDGTTATVPVSGEGSEVGITSKPGVLSSPTAEYKYNPGTSGSVQVTVENPGPNATGRQSWRQVR